MLALRRLVFPLRSPLSRQWSTDESHLGSCHAKRRQRGAALPIAWTLLLFRAHIRKQEVMEAWRLAAGRA